MNRRSDLKFQGARLSTLQMSEGWTRGMLVAVISYPLEELTAVDEWLHRTPSMRLRDGRQNRGRGLQLPFGFLKFTDGATNVRMAFAALALFVRLMWTLAGAPLPEGSVGQERQGR